MGIIKIIEPSVLAVTVEEASAHTLPSYDGDAALIEQYIKAMTAHGEKMTGRPFVATSFKMELDCFPPGPISLMPNLQSITKIEYETLNGVSKEVEAAEYKVKASEIIGLAAPKKSWPEQVDSVRVFFKAGWPVVDEKSTTPEDIKVWIMIRVAGMYEQRENFVLSKGGRFGLAPMPKHFCDHLLDCHIVPGFGAGI